jgi:hypothetical protein
LKEFEEPRSGTEVHEERLTMITCFLCTPLENEMIVSIRPRKLRDHAKAVVDISCDGESTKARGKAFVISMAVSTPLNQQ